MAGESPEFVAWVKRQPCLVCGEHPVDPHHAGQRAYGRRAHDETCVPLCPAHHREWHDCTGFFRDRLQRQAWTERAMCLVNQRYGRQSRAVEEVF